LLRIHRFDPTEVQFGDALVSSAIVWLRNRKPGRAHRIEFTYGGSLSLPAKRGLVAASRLDSAAKWTGLPAARTAAAAVARNAAAVTLGEYFRVKRGIATGANAFFIMTSEQAAERGIPRQCLRPILPGARQLESDEILADAAGVPLLTRSLWLLDCRLPEEKIRAEYPLFWRYLEAGRAGIGQGYLCRRRAPWYSQEVRASTHFLCTYMARRGGDHAQRFIFNRSNAIVANTYLMLYPREALARFIGGAKEHRLGSHARRRPRVWRRHVQARAGRTPAYPGAGNRGPAAGMSLLAVGGHLLTKPEATDIFKKVSYLAYVHTQGAAGRQVQGVRYECQAPHRPLHRRICGRSAPYWCAAGAARGRVASCHQSNRLDACRRGSRLVDPHCAVVGTHIIYHAAARLGHLDGGQYRSTSLGAVRFR